MQMPYASVARFHIAPPQCQWFVGKSTCEKNVFSKRSVTKATAPEEQAGRAGSSRVPWRQRLFQGTSP